MVESTTLNYHWTKPELQKSPTTWGKFLNDDLDAIDGLVFANQQGIVPIGAMTMFAGPAAPANWLICDGRTLDYGVTSAYQALFNVIGRAFNPALTGTQFALPNLATHFPFGANATNALGAMGGAGTVTLDATMIPAHTHPISDPKHTHTQTQTPHSHADAGHGHGVTEPPGGHVHGGNLLRQGAGSASLVSGSFYTVSGAGNTDGATTGITIQTGVASIQPINANLSAISTVATGIAVSANTGGGLAHDNMPPWVAINFIIRYL